MANETTRWQFPTYLSRCQSDGLYSEEQHLAASGTRLPGLLDYSVLDLFGKRELFRTNLKMNLEKKKRRPFKRKGSNWKHTGGDSWTFNLLWSQSSQWPSGPPAGGTGVPHQIIPGTLVAVGISNHITSELYRDPNKSVNQPQQSAIRIQPNYNKKKGK